MKSAISIVFGVVAIWSVSAAAQWPKYQTSGVPRDAQGRVDHERAGTEDRGREARPLRKLGKRRPRPIAIRACGNRW